MKYFELLRRYSKLSLAYGCWTPTWAVRAGKEMGSARSVPALTSPSVRSREKEAVFLLNESELAWAPCASPAQGCVHDLPLHHSTGPQNAAESLPNGLPCPFLSLGTRNKSASQPSSRNGADLK